jgi:DNA-binding transcriptional MerR regulator
VSTTTKYRPSPNTAPRGPNDSLLIGDLAAEFGVTLRALRFYEGMGLLSPGRASPHPNSQRIYGRRDRDRLMFILKAKKVGFVLSDIKTMLEKFAGDDIDTQTLGLTTSQWAERLKALEQQKLEVEAGIAEAQQVCKALATA